MNWVSSSKTRFIENPFYQNFAENWCLVFKETLSSYKNLSHIRSLISVPVFELFREFIKNFCQAVELSVLCLINRWKSLIEWLQVPAVSCWLFRFVSSGLWPVKFANLLLGDFIKFPLLSVLPFPSKGSCPKFPPLWIFYRKLLQFMNFESHAQLPVEAWTKYVQEPAWI